MKFHFTMVFFILVAAMMISTDACAYLDPGTGSYIFQVIIAMFIGSIFTLKIYWQKIKDFFRSFFTKNQ
jgi:uncharacterized paraquat-inducible protein A